MLVEPIDDSLQSFSKQSDINSKPINLAPVIVE
jgi:hypothetical protein